MRMLCRAVFRATSDRRAAASILDGYSWTSYGYKFGRWEWSGTLWTVFFSGRDGFKQTFRVFQLVDLRTGQPVGEMVARNRNPLGMHRMRKFSGTVEFAGDPALVGVYRMPGDRHAVFTHTVWGPYRKAARAARQMRTGAAPDAQFTDAVAARRTRFRAYHERDTAAGAGHFDRGLLNGDRKWQLWIADHPY